MCQMPFAHCRNHFILAYTLRRLPNRICHTP
jgi:hypothetical protein